MTRFLIKFGDNDFHNTFVPLCEYIGHIDADYTKEQLLVLINELSFGSYLLNQNMFKYGTAEENKHTRNYLKIDEKHLLVGEEMDEFIQTTSWDNGEAFYWDGYQSGWL